MERDVLIAQIAAAFDGVSREGGVSLREGQVLDDYGSAEARAEARLQDTDTRWQGVPDEDLKEYETSRSFFDAIGFRYYMPAYMTYALRHFNDGEWYEMSDVGWYFNLDGRNARMRDYALERFSLFTPAQGETVCHFLQFVAAYGYKFDARKANEAIESYWGQFYQGTL